MKSKGSFKVCSCGKTFSTMESFLHATRLVGVISTMHYMAHDLELRNCPSCKTTLSIEVEKANELEGSVQVAS